MNKLWFLDDERTVDDVTWISYDYFRFTDKRYFTDPQQFVSACLDIVDSGDTLSIPTVLSLDHDLGAYDQNGQELSGRWAFDSVLNPCIQDVIRGAQFADTAAAFIRTTWIFHTQNPVARISMHQMLEMYRNALDCIERGEGLNER